MSDRTDIEGVAQEVDKELAWSQADINRYFALTKMRCMRSAFVFIDTSIQLTKLAKYIFHSPVLCGDLTFQTV